MQLQQDHLDLLRFLVYYHCFVDGLAYPAAHHPLQPVEENLRKILQGKQFVAKSVQQKTRFDWRMFGVRLQAVHHVGHRQEPLQDIQRGQRRWCD